MGVSFFFSFCRSEPRGGKLLQSNERKHNRRAPENGDTSERHFRTKIPLIEELCNRHGDGRFAGRRRGREEPHSQNPHYLFGVQAGRPFMSSPSLIKVVSRRVGWTPQRLTEFGGLPRECSVVAFKRRRSWWSRAALRMACLRKGIDESRQGSEIDAAPKVFARKARIARRLGAASEKSFSTKLHSSYKNSPDLTCGL